MSQRWADSSFVTALPLASPAIYSLQTPSQDVVSRSSDNIGQISIQPFFGGEELMESKKRRVNVPFILAARTDWMWKAFFPEGENRDHEAVNVTRPRAMDITGVKYPKTMVVVREFDPLQDGQREFYEWLRDLGRKQSWWSIQMLFMLSTYFPIIWNLLSFWEKP